MRKTLLVVILTFVSILAIAQSSGNVRLLSGFPASSHWRNNPVDWSVKDGVLTIRAGEKTDWYIAPNDGQQVASSPLLLFPAPKDFWFSAKVTADFKSLFDAGALVLYVDEKNWVKFAFESPNGKTGAIISVVTRGLSDDNTGTAIEGNSVYLEISKSGQAIFLFFSTDGKKWNVTRAFNLGPEQSLQFGFSAQSPRGVGSTVTFSDIRYKPDALKPWSAD
jgi:uncharacterized protein